MIYFGIDVIKDKHDCCILGLEADKLYPVFTIPNNKAGFDKLYEKIFSVTDDKSFHISPSRAFIKSKILIELMGL